jgi:hypothetical protein
MIIPSILLVLLTVPVFLGIVQLHSTSAFLWGVGMIALLGAFSQPPGLVLLTEALPAAIRSRGLATVYAVAIATFGGSTQLIMTLLLRYSNDPMIPAYVLLPVSAIGVIAMFLLPETAPVKTGNTKLP